ncbi:reverse transcriptase domain-containing protein [Tanacetum coccineum]
MGLRGRTSTFLIRITDDDNDNLSSYATKGGSIINVDLTTTTLLPTGESSLRKTSGPTNAPDLRRKLASKLTGTVLGVKIMRQKEEAQEEKTKPNHHVKRDTSITNHKCILQAKAGKGQANSPKKPKKGVPAGQRKPQAKKRKNARELIRSYVTCSSKRQQEIKEEWNTADRESRRSYTRTKELYYSKNDHYLGGHWKSKKHRSNDEDDLSQPWLCDETDPFTVRIRNFEVPKKTRMPVNVKTYDGTRDPDDHLKIFQAAAKIERWAMPTWCYMLNSTLIGSARVLFDKLPPESIDNYEMLRKMFLGNYSQQKKYIKDPVEIHHIKQREGESMEAFMERFKAESMHVSEARECMKMSGFMHGITNPDLIKKLNDNIPKSVDETMSVTTAFLRGEVAAANQSKNKAPPTWNHHETSHKPNFDKRLDFKNQHKSNRRQDRFTPLTKTPKEILAMDTVKFKAPPPMTGPAENRNKNKFCEFHVDKGHNTDECIHLRSGRRNSDDPQHHHNTSGMRDDDRSPRPQPAQRASGHRKNQNNNPPRVSGPNRHDQQKPILNRKIGTLQLAKRKLRYICLEAGRQTGVPRSVAEHRLNIREGCQPIRQKRKGHAPDRNKAIQEEVAKLVEAGIMKEVHYHDWLSNPIMVKSAMTAGECA